MLIRIWGLRSDTSSTTFNGRLHFLRHWMRHVIRVTNVASSHSDRLFGLCVLMDFVWCVLLDDVIYLFFSIYSSCLSQYKAWNLCSQTCLTVQQFIVLNQRSGFLVQSLAVLRSSGCKQGEKNTSTWSTGITKKNCWLGVGVRYLFWILDN